LWPWPHGRITDRYAAAARPIRPRAAGAAPIGASGEADIYQRLRTHWHFPIPRRPRRRTSTLPWRVLQQLLAVEVHTTQARRVASRLWFGCLPTESSLDAFDISAQRGAGENIRELASLRFLDDAPHPVRLPTGTGTTMLANGPARAAAQAGHRVYFTTADDHAKRCHKPLWRASCTIRRFIVPAPGTQR
jgi:hypothetical protein